MKRVIKWWLGANLAGAIIMILLPGRKVANAHPEVRGGGDHGFGGLDYYEGKNT